MRAPASAPSVLVVTSTRLAIRTGEKICSPSTVTLSPRPTSVARWISSPTLPEMDVTTQTAPSPAKSVRLRRASIASRPAERGREGARQPLSGRRKIRREIELRQRREQDDHDVGEARGDESLP